jgi:hypothetical protein
MTDKMADRMKDNKDAESGEPVQLDKEPKQPMGQPGQQQPGQPQGPQHEGGQKR